MAAHEKYNEANFSEDANFLRQEETSNSKNQYKILEEKLTALEKYFNDKLSEKARVCDIETLWKSCQAAFMSKAANLIIVEAQKRMETFLTKEVALRFLKSLEMRIDNAVTKEEFAVINKIVESHDFDQIRETVKTVNINSNELDSLRIYDTQGEIASADLLTLNATPVDVITKPGANKFINIVTLQLFLDYNSTPYVVAANEDLSIEYVSGENIITAEMTGFLDQSSDQRQHYGEETHPIPLDTGIRFKMLNGEVTGGDSPLKYKIRYRILDAIA